MRALEIPRSYLRNLKSAYINNNGFHTNRKIVVVESDDWGSIRMPSRDIYDRLLNNGDSCNKDAFLKNDALESEYDLSCLYDVLSKYKDKNGRHPCITANFAVANPDFYKISMDRSQYSYLPFTKTYEEYYGSDRSVMQLIKEGINNHLFIPQLHCREHLNVARWMTDLNANKKDVEIAFQNKMIGIGASFSKDNIFGYMDAFNYDTKAELEQLKSIIGDASTIFESSFGFKSRTFVASCYVWTKEIEKQLSEIGVEMIQTQFKQNVCPFKGTQIILNKYHYTGQKNKLGQLYSVRNCSYESAYDQNYESRADECVQSVMASFAACKPAIINSHRFNYIHSIDPQNGENGINGLDIILRKLLEAEPEIEFLSSVELLELMSED